MSNIAPSFKNLETDQDASAIYQRSTRRRNGIVIPHSSPVYEELQKKIHEPETQSSFGSVPSASSHNVVE